MAKRILLFLLTNVAILVTVSIILNLLGVKPYLTAYGIDYTSLMIFCLVWGFAGAFISLLMSKFMAKMFMGVKLVEATGPYGQLVQKVHLMAKRAGIEKMPEVGIYESPDVNAFATGPSKNNSLVAVSTGLLQKMNSDEVEGVLGHEVAHIANGDMVTMTLVQGVVNAFVMFLARVVAHFISQAMRGDNDRGGGLGPIAYMITVFVLEILFGVLGMMVVATFSRYREFRADEGGAKLAGKDKMIAALQGLIRAYPQLATAEAHAGNDRGSEIKSMQISSKSSFMAMLSTHPPLEKRIAALQKLP